MFNATARYQRNAAWLIQLRWVAVIGQIVTTAAVWLLGIEIPMAKTVLGLILLTAISNVLLTVLFQKWKARSDSDSYPWNLMLGLILIVDLLSLTGLLYVTGGPNNPFFLFFFVNLSLCALLLDRNWTLAINALTVLCFAGLLIQHQSLPPLDLGFESLESGGQLTMQHLGSLVAFSTCSGVIVYFMTRLTGELAEQQAAVREAEAVQARSEKIEALGTLAAGAAHELATPLSTIAVVAKEVEQAVDEQSVEFPEFVDIVEDVQLIRNQLARCRAILDRMAGHAGETIGESIKPYSIKQLSDATVDGLAQSSRVQVSLPSDSDQQTILAPLDGLTQALRCLIQNAIDADPSGQPVLVNIFREPLASGDVWKWEIRDRGIGMSAKQLERVSEPFFTTKPPGKGMGLGVFLAQNVLTRLDGSLHFESTPGQGTCVTICLPG
jgi:two-component system sensor histidine kinase RegB